MEEYSQEEFAEFITGHLRYKLSADETKKPLNTGEFSFRSFYGDAENGGASVTVIVDESTEMTEDDETTYGAVFARGNAFGKSIIDMNDVIGTSFNYLFAGIFSLIDGDMLMQINIGSSSYYDGDKKDGNITEDTPDINVEFSFSPYGEKKFGGDVSTLISLVDDYADDVRGEAINFMNDIDKMAKG